MNLAEKSNNPNHNSELATLDMDFWENHISSFTSSHVFPPRGSESESAVRDWSEQNLSELITYLNGENTKVIPQQVEPKHVLNLIGRHGGEAEARSVIDLFQKLSREEDKIAALDCVAAIGGLKALKLLAEVAYSQTTVTSIGQVAYDAIDELFSTDYDMLLGPRPVARERVLALLEQTK